ncbi:S8 family serine peptidase [Candidatus Woesearchaeota archaeon]|nr:S8 family serine peptidase [Candidatus Woesearchaeota archaeon]
MGRVIFVLALLVISFSFIYLFNSENGISPLIQGYSVSSSAGQKAADTEKHGFNAQKQILEKISGISQKASISQYGQEIIRTKEESSALSYSMDNFDAEQAINEINAIFSNNLRNKQITQNKPAVNEVIARYGSGGDPSSSSATASPEESIKKETKPEDKIHPELKEKIEESGDETIPIIIHLSDLKKVEELIGELESGNGDEIGKYAIGDLVTVNIPAKNIEKIAESSDVLDIWPERQVSALLDNSSLQINAPVAWDFGYNGSGVKIAVLDTGINPSHPMLNGKVIHEKSFITKDTMDYLGHGTHVAGIIAGTKEFGGEYRGIAPGAELINIKVLDDAGIGSDIGVIAAINYAVEQGADIISISFGGKYSDPESPINLAIKGAVEQGVTVVVPSGNCGKGCPNQMCNNFSGVGTPGDSLDAITVGAVDENNNLACFSAGGVINNDAVKPDIVAPGVNVISSAANGYKSASGTSVSVPHVVGAVAILLQKNPKLTPSEIKKILEESSIDLGRSGEDIQYGYGLLDIGKLVSPELPRINSVSIPTIVPLNGTVNLIVNITDDKGIESVKALIISPSGNKTETILSGTNGLWNTTFTDTSAEGHYILNVVVTDTDNLTSSTAVGFRVSGSMSEEILEPASFILDNVTGNISAQWWGIEPTNNVCWGADGTPCGTGYWQGKLPGGWLGTDIDWMSYTSCNAGKLKLNFDPPSDLDGVLEVYKGCSWTGTGTDRVCYKDSYGNGGEEKCEVNLNNGETVYFLIWDYNNKGSNNNYYLYVDFEKTETCPETSGCDSCKNKANGYGCDCFGECSSEWCWGSSSGSYTCRSGCASDGYYAPSASECCSGTVWDSSTKKCRSSCTSQDSYSCYDSDIYWYNSCSSREGKKEECGTSSYTGNNYCYDSDVYKDYITRGCSGSSCTSPTGKVKQQECGTSGYTGNNYCYDNDVYNDYVTIGCSGSSCTSTTGKVKQKECDFGCSNNQCNTCINKCSYSGQEKCDGYTYSRCETQSSGCLDWTNNGVTKNKCGVECTSSWDCGFVGWGYECINYGCVECTAHASWTCSDNDVYYYNACGWREEQKQECGTTGCGNWGSDYCSSDGGKVLKSRTCYDKGCRSSACYIENQQTEIQEVKPCMYGCENGKCLELPDLSISSEDIIFERIE